VSSSLGVARREEDKVAVTAAGVQGECDGRSRADRGTAGTKAVATPPHRAKPSQAERRKTRDRRRVMVSVVALVAVVAVA
jgi:hypothetical protein